MSEHQAHELLPSYMVPVRVETLGSLPRTPSGKVDVPALRSRAENGTGGHGRAQDEAGARGGAPTAVSQDSD